MNNLGRSLVLALATVVSAQPLLAKPEKWVGTWASSPLLDVHAKLAEEVLTGATLREVVHVSIGGDTVRVRFSNLYGTSPLDPLVLITMMGSLLLTAVLACALPAIRASKIEPMQALRTE